MRILSLLLVAALFGACYPYHRAEYTPATHFFQNEVARRSVSPKWNTPRGIEVDPTTTRVNPLRIDRLVDEVEACLAPFGGTLAPEVVQAAACSSPAFGPVPRSSMTVVVIDDWFLSSVEFAGSKHQMIPGWVVADGCTEKGMVPGPCYRRVGIIENTTIVTPPALYLFKEAVLKITTGCHFPWSSPALAACMTPTTGPLDDGSGP
jgi:hypothetical protein